jgi:hypothetical protein
MRRAVAINFERLIVVLFLFLLSFVGIKALGQSSAFPHSVFTETTGKVHIAVHNSRPLAQVIAILQDKYAWRINYEDPQYTAKLDYRQVKNDSGERRVPNGGDFAVDFPAGAAPGASPDEAKTLQLIVDAYNQTDNPGRFELRHKTPEQFDVVGNAAHDSQGKISSQPVTLDVAITLPAADREFESTMDLICQKISEKAHVPVQFGSYPENLASRHVTVGGKELTAREYVLAAADASGRRLCLGLLFDPESAGYYLNLTTIKKQPAAPASPAKP